MPVPHSRFNVLRCGWIEILGELPARIRLCFELHQIHLRLCLPAAFSVFRHDIGKDAAAHIEFCGEAHEARLGRGDQIIEDAIGHVFVKMAFVAE